MPSSHAAHRAGCRRYRASTLCPAATPSPTRPVGDNGDGTGPQGPGDLPDLIDRLAAHRRVLLHATERLLRRLHQLRSQHGALRPQRGMRRREAAHPLLRVRVSLPLLHRIALGSTSRCCRGRRAANVARRGDGRERGQVPPAAASRLDSAAPPPSALDDGFIGSSARQAAAAGGTRAAAGAYDEVREKAGGSA